MDLIYRDPADCARLAGALASSGLPVFLPRLMAESPTVTAMTDAWDAGVVIRWPAPGCPYIQLSAQWAQDEPPLNAGRRSDLRRARRHAERMGGVDTQILAPTVSELDPLLEAVFHVEGCGWKSRSGTALAIDHPRSEFFRCYAKAAAAAGILRLCFLRIGDRFAAVQFAVECESRFWLLKIGYDESFAKSSPGLLLLADTVRYAAARGLETYEFLGVPEPWIRVWTDQVRECVSLRAYPSRRAGLTAIAADVAQAGRRRLGRFLTGEF
jgi:CelD/BcsL family acetyltransferase involved in cellulose biosynthesis